METAKNLRGGTALGRYGQPHEIAAVVALLASPDANDVTCANIDVGGGSIAAAASLKALS